MDEEGHPRPGGNALNYGDVRMGTQKARAAAVAKGNISGQQATETLDLPEVHRLFSH